MSRFHRISTLAFTASAALALASMAFPAQASARPASGWRVAFHHQEGKDTYSSYNAVVAPAKDNVWAFGGESGADPNKSVPAAARWNGRRWRTAALPHGLAGAVYSASAPSRSDIWAASARNGWVLHWNGRGWRVAKRWPIAGREITDVTAVSASDVWVFGGEGAFAGIGTWHYNGHRWAHVTGAATGIETASPLSGRDIWAIGSAGALPQDVLVHYNGTRWSNAAAAALRNVTFASIVAVSKDSVWATGQTTGQTTARPLLVHWNGASWRRVHVPAGLAPFRISSDGRGGLWMAAQARSSPSLIVMLHRSAAAVWTKTSLGSFSDHFTNALAPVPGSRVAVAAGQMPEGQNYFAAAVYASGAL